jgi:hypothetical protein
MEDIVVVANPQETVPSFFNAPSPPPGPGSPQDQLMRQAQFAAANCLEIDTDATDDEVVVIGQRLRQAVRSTMNYTMTFGNSMVNLPCIGRQSPALIRGIAGSLKIKVTSKDYGPGRAGANFAGSSSTTIPVEINNVDLKGYGLLPGGTNYLVLHEIAHSFKAMRDFSQSQFTAYQNGAGKGLSLADQKAQYYSSPEFAENEARANSIAKALATPQANLGFDFTPTHGFSTSC